jgi:hypothetical protein
MNAVVCDIKLAGDEFADRLTTAAGALLTSTETFREVIEAALCGSEGLSRLFEIRSEDVSTSGALEVSLRLQATEAGLDLVAALGAAQRELDLVNARLAHFITPSAGVFQDPPEEGESPGSVQSAPATDLPEVAP